MLPAELATQRLLLRAPLPADAREIFTGYAQIAEVSRFMMWRPHASLAVTEAYIAQCIAAFENGVRLPYVLAKRGEPAVAIGMLEARPAGHIVELGYVLAPRHWGAGLMPEAVAALSATVLADPACFRVQAFCDVENLQSQRALDKAGFTREARLARFAIHPNVSEEPRPCYMYARCR
jgi:[ribosomal protein S5]-alanine N-acetyltransferase